MRGKHLGRLFFVRSLHRAKVEHTREKELQYLRLAMQEPGEHRSTHPSHSLFVLTHSRYLP